MATIRTQLINNVRRVITKVTGNERKVSCSCCDGVGCCPYPAQGLIDGDYTEDDLPDKIRVYVDAEGNYGLADRSGEEYQWTFTDGEGVPRSAKIKVNPDVVFDIGAAWAWELDGTWTFGPEVCPCLFGVCFPEYGVEDNFADTYYWQNEFTSENDVPRADLCSWQGIGRLFYYSGQDDGPTGNNSYVEFFYNGPAHRWVFIREGLQADEGGGVWEKDDPQNGPEGTYSPSTNVTGNSFAGIGTLTFAEA